jgi:amidophosphoribosyltransferase
MNSSPAARGRRLELVRRTPVTGSPVAPPADQPNPVSAALADDLNDDPGPRDACGVFGAFARGEEVAKLAYYGLYALQHRGQEAAGIAVSDGDSIVVYKELGLVSQVFDEITLSSLAGHIAVGHTRYSTTGSCTWENAQPSYRTHDRGGIALGHNGNLTNTADVAARLARMGGRGAVLSATTDSELITGLLANSELGLEKAALDTLPLLEGAFCLVFCDESTLCAARDPHGIHPLVLGRLGPAEAPTGWVVASETAALDIVGAQLVREVEAGEMLVIDDDGVRTHRFATATPHGCLFEYVYLARPDTTIAGRSVHAARVEVGRTLAREAPAAADLVIPVPDSGTPAAIGYAEQSGIPYGAGLVKNAYVGRTFIQPSQTIRQLGIRLKLNPLRDVIAGKRLVVVDDSVVRGNTQAALVKMLRESGAAEVHVRISSPPVRWPCFYGIDFATRDELIATGRGIEEIRQLIGADSLAFVTLEGLVAATNQPDSGLCKACFTGSYPVALADPGHRGKGMLETGSPSSVSPSNAPIAEAGAPDPLTALVT